MVREDGATASKESRRERVAAQYRILLLVGDNLNDFTDDFAGKSIAERLVQVDRERADFGNALHSFLIRCMENGKMLFTKTSRA